MKSLLMGLGIVYAAGFVMFSTYHLAHQDWRDVPEAVGYGLTWPLQIARAGPDG